MGEGGEGWGKPGRTSRCTSSGLRWPVAPCTARDRKISFQRSAPVHGGSDGCDASVAQRPKHATVGQTHGYLRLRWVRDPLCFTDCDQQNLHGADCSPWPAAPGQSLCLHRGRCLSHALRRRHVAQQSVRSSRSTAMDLTAGGDGLSSVPSDFGRPCHAYASEGLYYIKMEPSFLPPPARPGPKSNADFRALLDTPRPPRGDDDRKPSAAAANGEKKKRKPFKPKQDDTKDEEDDGPKYRYSPPPPSSADPLLSHWNEVRAAS